MKSTDKKPDPLPENFGSEDEASEFWDTHCITDYEDFLDPVNLEVDLCRQHFEIEVDEEAFLALRSTASKRRKSVKQIASEILKEKLEAA